MSLIAVPAPGSVRAFFLLLVSPPFAARDAAVSVEGTA